MGYFEALLAGITALATWPAAGLLIVGIAIGLVIGILPGLGTPLAFALMLPFVFEMSPVEAFAFLLGMHAVLNIAGEVTAVLFAVPGARSATAAIVDGHPMVKRGEPGRALGNTLYASLFGGLIGVAVLMAAIPIVRPIVLAMGNPELFMLILFAVLCVAALSRDRLLPGLISGGLGFALGFIGQSRITGETRFSFGLLELWDGFPLIPLVLGLFAVPEIMQLAIKRTAIAGDIPDATESGRQDPGMIGGLKDNLRHWKLLVQASGFGTVLGMLPGVGSSAVQWIVYSWARARSNNPEEFGHGSPEGLLAPSSATNADEGGALTTTIAFGIPGGSGMALLLTAFIIVGVAPGPSMLDTNLDLTMSMVWILFFAHVLGVLVFLLAAKQVVKITRLRGTVLLPFLVSLVLVGGYVSTYSMAGVAMTLLLGVLGYLMVVLNWPRPPLILAFILAPIAENYLWLTLQLYGLSFLVRPIVLLIAAAIVAYTVYVFRRPETKQPVIDTSPSA